MKAHRFFQNFWLSVSFAGLALLPGCGGGSGSTRTTVPPSLSCSLQVEAFDPPAPGDGDWNAFQKYILPNTAIHGVDLVVPWNTVDTGQPGQANEYDFSSLDSSFANYSGKTINLIFQPIDYSNINNPGGGINGKTPSYVFTTSWATTAGASSPQDVTYCSDYPGNTGFAQNLAYANANTAGFDPAGYPVVYEAPFAVAYQNFISAVLQHYKGNSNIGYMRFGLSVGNETSAYCEAELQQLPAPNTFVVPTTWKNWISTMDTFVKSAEPSPSIQLMQSLNELGGDGNTDMPDFEAAQAVANGFGFGNNGLQKSDIAASASNQPCTGDWCAMFDKYAGQVPLELQEADPSDPSGADPTNATGNLAQLIPLAVAHHATILEVLMDDLYLAYNPNYTPKYPGDSSYSGAYATALNSPCTAQ
jgi:hypothetical protein